MLIKSPKLEALTISVGKIYRCRKSSATAEVKLHIFEKWQKWPFLDIFLKAIY